MKNQFLLLVAFQLLGLSAQAELAGRWIGWGEWTYEGQGTRCDIMTLDFIESEKKLSRGEGLFDCGIVALHVPSQDFEKKDNNLLIDGRVVGSYKDNTYQWSEPYSPTVTVATTIKVDGRHFDYQEIWTNKQNIEIYVIKGRLFLRE